MKKYMDSSSFLIIGILLILFGIIILVGGVPIFENISNIVLILMILISMKDLFSLLQKKEEKKFKIFGKILNTFLAIIALVFNEYSIAIVPILFSIYMICNGILGNLVEYVIYKLNKMKCGARNLIEGLIYLSIGLMVLFSPIIYLDLVLKILGIYSVLLGFSYIMDYLELKHHKKFPRIKICLPSIIEAIIPLSVLQNINKMINKNDDVIYVQKKNDEKVDLEILIHVTENGFGRLGHMDICFEGEIISFGNYDKSTYRLFEGTGSGILFFIKDRNKYIKFCIENSKKTLFVFGLKLTEKEKQDIRKNIDKIKDNLVPWNPPCVEYKNKKHFKKKEFTDYASKLYRKTKAKFYKFKTGKYKIYFVLGNNCVSLSNKIIGKALKDSFKISGIITPGTYYDYLEREFMKKNSIVVSKKIYNKNNINKLK